MNGVCYCFYPDIRNDSFTWVTLRESRRAQNQTHLSRKRLRPFLTTHSCFSIRKKINSRSLRSRKAALLPGRFYSFGADRQVWLLQVSSRVKYGIHTRMIPHGFTPTATAGLMFLRSSSKISSQHVKRLEEAMKPLRRQPRAMYDVRTWTGS
uniref:AlNc14C94G5774 protein n=1 Tax=Albugo laibachii Nc14 TaxID=890382 RepID=F0WGP7_9STRA|nr:AlNc14C94G5774 [Albugo laibachii Nc14]|eukprot:CCA20411.1 AlNc14C94G5774 [Albugo laibachii Nc14]